MSEKSDELEFLEQKRYHYLLASFFTFVAFMIGLVLICLFYAVTGAGVYIGVLLIVTMLPTSAFLFIVKCAGIDKKISSLSQND
ncbi:MAG: hypothetical protein PVI21_01150 [Candidatus Woesebacteria bacterium]